MFKVKEYVSRKLNTVCIAHRGFSALYPENSLLAFKRAIDIGANVIELDIRETKDKELIIFHDPNLKRIAGIDSEISSLSLNEIRKIDLGMSQKIPTLREVLELVSRRVGLNVHMYISGDAIDRVISLCDEYKMLESIFLALSNKEDIIRVKRDYPDVYVCSGYRASKDDYLGHTIKLGAEILQPPFGARYLNRKWMELVHENGLVAEVFYADTYNDMLALKRIGIDGILTNNPPVFFLVFSRA